MAVATGICFNYWKYQLLTGFTWISADVRGALFLANTWTPNPDNQYLSAATSAGAIELTVSGYSRQAIPTKTVAVDTALDAGLLDGDTIVWPISGAGQDYDTVVIYNQVTNDANSFLIAAFTLDTTMTTVGGSVYFTLDPAALLTLT